MTCDIKGYILKEFASLNDNLLADIENWIISQNYKRDLEKIKSLNKSDKCMKKISKYIKTLIPFEAEMSTEKIQAPTVGDQKDCTEKNCCHIDEFLYDDDEVELLVSKGKLHRYYCLECQSKDVKETSIKYYSMPRKTLQYIFKVLLPKDLEEKNILNVGSKIGATIFTAYYHTNAKLIIGIETDKKCCEIQENIINKLSMEPRRIKIENVEIFERKDIVQSSDVIILNLTDCFLENDITIKLWSFLKSNLKKGSFIVTNESVSKTLSDLEMYEEYVKWLLICKPCQIENEMLFSLSDFVNSDLYLYKVN